MLLREAYPAFVVCAQVAVDASMSIYQFLIAMQRPDGTVMLTNAEGETTSHLQVCSSPAPLLTQAPPTEATTGLRFSPRTSPTA